ncbi:MAG: sugar ABC transporter permease [Thermotogae bacterium]|nr:sugar ABC transporter permease [Thermotogota bacterium]
MKTFLGYFYLLPVIVIVGILIIFPLFWTGWISFQSKQIGGEATFVGFKNYFDLIKNGDFFDALWKSIYFTSASIFFKLVLGLAAALILNQNFRGRSLIRTWLFIPWTIPRFATAIIFLWFFRQSGGLDLILRQFGIVSPYWFSPKLVMPTMIFVNVWKGFPFFMVSILAGLQAIPNELYEAATVDGANRLQVFQYITLPLLKNVILIATTLSTIWTISEFDVIFLMTGGGPGTSSQVIPILTYVKAFRQYDLGQATALAMLTLPIFIALIISLIKLTPREGER